MNTILTVFKKEMLDTLRDKRTLLTAIVGPALLMPILLYGMTKLTSSIMEKEENKKLKVAILDAPPDFALALDTAKFEIIPDVTIEFGREQITADSLDAMIGFHNRYAANIEEMKSGKVNMWYKSTNLLVKDRLTQVIDDYEEKILNNRISELSLTKDAIDPINLIRYDIAPKNEQIGQMVGGFLPYIFIIFCFMGCMYPALDLITGEKERGTIETLLTVPASKFNILMGKVLTIALVGLSAALMTILGLIVAVKFLPDLPPDILEAMSNIIGVKFVLMLFAMLIPMAIFFGGVISAMVVRAKSFKEAQSIVTPASFLVIIPAVVALLPGIKLDWSTVFIPILNVALATKEIVAGTIQPVHYIVVVVSLIILAIIAVAISYRQFSKESMIL
jgi:sodium transport system permease protein